MNAKNSLSTYWRDHECEKVQPKKRETSGNYADYVLCKPHVCCGWMNMHSDLDQGATRKDPYMAIRALYWHPDARLIVRDESNRFVAIEPTAEVVVFNGAKLHGLLPSYVAKEVVKRQNLTGPAMKTFALLVQDGEFEPKLVWDWVEVTQEMKPKAEKPYWMYLLECQDGSFYCGIARDVDKRFQEHSTGKGAAYTRSHPPLRVLARRQYDSKSEALKAEIALKKCPKHKKLGFFDQG